MPPNSGHLLERHLEPIANCWSVMFLQKQVSLYVIDGSQTQILHLMNFRDLRKRS